MSRDPGAPANDMPSALSQARTLFVADAWRNPEYTRFAAKLTLAVMTCYLIERLTAWPGIHTCLITCFFVSLETVGQSVHKMTLRIGGCLVGAALGLATVLFIMPSLEDLGDLLLVMAPVMLLAGWIKSGSERSAYAGQQIALAYFIWVLQGYGPSIVMEDGRDRIVGILLGDVTVYLVFTRIWPVSVAEVVRSRVSDAVKTLADLLATPVGSAKRVFDAQEERTRQRFAQLIAQARQVMVNDPFETDRIRSDRGRQPIDAAVLTKVQALIIPVSIIMAERRHSGVGEGSMQPMTDWLRRWAGWIRTGEGEAELGFPATRAETDGDHMPLAAWRTILKDDVRAIVQEIGPARHGPGEALEEHVRAEP